VFLLYYHLVLVVKYRRKVIDDPISDYAKDMFVRLGKNYDISLVEWNHDMDHVHILFKAHPNSERSKFINAYKSASQKAFSESEKKTVERIFLVKKLLPAYNGWCAH
jgi:putative transposase